MFKVNPVGTFDTNRIGNKTQILFWRLLKIPNRVRGGNRKTNE